MSARSRTLLMLALASACPLAGCVDRTIDPALLSTSTEEAKQRVALTPPMRQAIAIAVEATHPLWRAPRNKVVVADISAPKVGRSNNGGAAYLAYYCVRAELDRPLLNFRQVFVVFPMKIDTQHATYRVEWKEYKVPRLCEGKTDYQSFPELRMIYEGPQAAAL